MAIGNHSRILSPNSPASITQKSQSVTARSDVAYLLFGRVVHEGLSGAGVDPALVGPQGLDLGVLHLAVHAQGAGQQHEEAGRRLPLGVDRAAAGPGLAVAVLAQPGQLVVLQGLEQEQRRAARPGSAGCRRRSLGASRS